MKSFFPFKNPTLKEVQQREICETELALHEARIAKDRADATVSMFETRLERLRREHFGN
jgi:hypothetical protein